MRPSCRPTAFKNTLPGLSLAVLAVCVTAGCTAATPTPQASEGTVVATRTTSALINEGGPVYGLPGDGGNLINEGGAVFGKPSGPAQFHIDALAVPPSYYKGNVSDLSVTAELLDGVTYPSVSASAIASNGTFTLQGADTAKFFFTSASFQWDDSTNSLRAVAQADNTSQLTLDVASTLLAAKVALAGQKRELYTIDYEDTQSLATMVRGHLGSQLDSIRLDVANEELSDALSALASRDTALSERLKQWEFTLDPTLGSTPVPLSSMSGGTGSASSAPRGGDTSVGTTATPPPGAPPVK